MKFLDAETIAPPQNPKIKTEFEIDSLMSLYLTYKHDSNYSPLGQGDMAVKCMDYSVATRSWVRSPTTPGFMIRW